MMGLLQLGWMWEMVGDESEKVIMGQILDSLVHLAMEFLFLSLVGNGKPLLDFMNVK